jgi:bifunctional enzyme CysN/CysC
MLCDQGIITICSFISPDEDIRNQVAEIIGEDRFHMIYMDADLDYSRNNKPTLYEQAEQGKIENMPGVDSKYDAPVSPDLTLKPQNQDTNVDTILDYLLGKKIFPLK